MTLKTGKMTPAQREFRDLLLAAAIRADDDAKGLEIPEILAVYSNMAGRLMWLAGINGWDLAEIETLMNLNVNQGISEMMDAHDLGNLGTIGAERTIASLKVDTSRLN